MRSLLLRIHSGEDNLNSVQKEQRRGWVLAKKGRKDQMGGILDILIEFATLSDALWQIQGLMEYVLQSLLWT